jgi:phosphonopyruvate decarboxylase
MTIAKSLSEAIQKSSPYFISGVPDSGIKDDLKDVVDIKHHIAVDEGQAVAMAVGFYTATKSVPLVYMQSDGLCNALNAITSLVIPYKIPMNIFISMRRTHPQHEVMGRMTEDIVNMLEFEALRMGNNHLTFYIYDKQRKSN